MIAIEKIYHYVLAALAAFVYGFPSKKLYVIAVTGAKGKTATRNLIAQILNSAGYKTGIATAKLGSFKLQKSISKMVKEGCKYAVIETSSCGFIDYDMAVLTNSDQNYIEKHGIEIFKKVAAKKNGIGIYNLDDENVKYFLEPKVFGQYVYTLKLKQKVSIPNLYQFSKIKTSAKGMSFYFNGEKFETPLAGEFNVYNAAAAICAALSQNVPIWKIRQALQTYILDI